MDCLECHITINRHNELNNEIKFLTDLDKLITRGMINQAAQDCQFRIAQLQRLNNQITGR